MTPSDARKFNAKYSGRCSECRTAISIGESCLWSPSSKKLGCTKCWGEIEATKPTSTRKASAKVEDSDQKKWQQLCTYLRTCLLAEAGETVIEFVAGRFPTVSGQEHLLTTNSSSAILRGAFVDQNLRKNQSTDNREYLYGWPTVVVNDIFGRTKVAPLFVIACSIKKDPIADHWIIETTSDPDLNIALLSGKIFDASTAAEIEATINGDIAFGDRKKLIAQIQLISETLKLTCFSLTDNSLADSYTNKPGIYNAALLLDASDNRASKDLLLEIDILAKRTDWVSTAASSLIFGIEQFENRLKKSKAWPVGGPLFLNRTQEEATESSRSQRITVVTGPPGTGKSQLVVGAVSNAWLDNESVLVTSTNNGAVDVAVNRGNETVSGLLLRTGNRGARDALPNLVSTVISNTLRKTFTKTQSQLRANLALAQTTRKSLHQLLVNVEELEFALTQLVYQLEDLANVLWTHKKRTDFKVTDIEIANQSKKLWRAIWFRKRRLIRFLSTVGIEISKAQLPIAKEWVTLVNQFESDHGNLQAICQSQLQDLNSQLLTTDESWVSSSKSALEVTIADLIRKNPKVFSQIGNTGGDGGKLVPAISFAMKALKGWACTTLSMHRNFELQAGLFDLAIIDEASQCNIAYVLPVAYRSKRLLVVGDPNQLPPINQVGRKTVDSIADQTEASPLIAHNRGLDFLEGSAYSAFENIVGRENTVLLNEHYRCHPKIARWFNEAFYGGTLQVVTDISKMTGENRGISWIDIDGKATRPTSGNSWLNQREIEETVAIVREVADLGLSVGVVSPFSAQAFAIQRAVESLLPAEKIGEIAFTAGTAHRFQGDERDVMIFTSCIAPGILPASARWVEKERNLINVAVSRARHRLIILGHPVIDTLESPTLASLRNFAIDTHDQGGKVGHRVDSESERRLLEAMIIAGLSPLAKLDVEGLELDFALIIDDKKFDIEVDGDQHFDKNLQRRRQDNVRDRVLMRAGWEVIRIPAWRCFREPAEVVEELLLSCRPANLKL